MWQTGIAQAKYQVPPKNIDTFLSGFAGGISKVLQSTARHKWSHGQFLQKNKAPNMLTGVYASVVWYFLAGGQFKLMYFNLKQYVL